jgi:hypothetical protein
MPFVLKLNRFIMANRRVTIKDVAKKAGLSIKWVQLFPFVLNNKGRVGAFHHN